MVKLLCFKIQVIFFCKRILSIKTQMARFISNCKFKKKNFILNCKFSNAEFLIVRNASKPHQTKRKVFFVWKYLYCKYCFDIVVFGRQMWKSNFCVQISGLNRVLGEKKNKIDIKISIFFLFVFKQESLFLV